MAREASGTAWQPDSSPMRGVEFSAGMWRFITHGFLYAVYSDESGPRGGTGRFGTGMLMLMGQRSVPARQRGISGSCSPPNRRSETRKR
jgi:hypothetical protein